MFIRLPWQQRLQLSAWVKKDVGITQSGRERKKFDLDFIRIFN